MFGKDNFKQENEFDNFQAQNPIEDQLDVIGSLVRAIQQLQTRVGKFETQSVDNVEIKSTTGDFAVGSSWDGRRVINTFDNTYKIFAESAWRTIVNW